jgi:hypothetical protein
MESRTQYRAQCSVCGRDHAVRGARMVAHGYRVPTGWHQFVGECSGTDRAHFGTPEGRELRASIAASFRKSYLTTTAEADRVASGTGVVRVWQREPDSAMSRSRGAKWAYLQVEDPKDYQRREWAEHLTREATRLERTAKEIEVTVAAWVEKAPREVEVDQKPVVLHAYSARWRGKACAASAMGAQRGNTVDDRSQVTCSKCLEYLRRADERAAAKAKIAV